MKFLGVKSSLTVAAKRMMALCVDRIGEKEDRLMRLEKAINPLLDDNDQVGTKFHFGFNMLSSLNFIPVLVSFLHYRLP